MEGIAGLANWNEPKERIRREMVQDLLAAIEGAKEGGATEFVVADSHAMGVNFNPEDLPEGVRLVRGFPRPYYMMEGLDESFDGVFFIGYHAPAGCLRGQMDHTYSSYSFYEIKINGKIVGEAEINALYAGEMGVPVLLITGDEALVEFSKKNFPDGVRFVAVKRGISRYSAELEHPETARRKIKEMAHDAVRDLSQIPPFRMKPPYEIQFTLKETIQADFASIIPFIRRKGGRTLIAQAMDGRELMRYVITISLLASIPKFL